MATRQCMNKWHFSDWLIVTRQFLVGCLSGQPWKEEDSTTTFNQEKHGKFRISDEPRIHIYRQNRCSRATQQEQCDGTTKRVRVARGKKKKNMVHRRNMVRMRYVTRDILPSPVKKVGNILACHINGLCTICLSDGWFVQDTWRSASCLFSLLHVVATHVIILSDF